MNPPTCKACDLDEYLGSPDTDLSACCPPALNHTCKKKGPKTRRQVTAALTKAAHDLYFGFGAKMPGGNYHARDEIEALIFRLAHR